jgi:hypothetical protein
MGPGWVNFQVLRKTHSTLMREQEVDPKIVADQQGHDVDVNLNVSRKRPWIKGRRLSISWTPRS